MIAYRVLKNRKTNKNTTVSIRRPMQDEDGVWYVLIEIGEYNAKVHGEDSMQALILSFDAIRRHIDKNFKHELEWNGSEFLGFPYSIPMFLPFKVIVDLENMLEQKVEEKLGGVLN